MMATRVSARKTTFLKPIPAMKAKRVRFDQMKVSERRTDPKNWNEVDSTNKKKPPSRQFQMIKSNNEVTLKTRETYFLYRKPQKLKITNKISRKLFSKILLKIFSLLGKSHSAEKWPAIAEIINWVFTLKWAEMNRSSFFFEILCVFLVHWLFLSLNFM